MNEEAKSRVLRIALRVWGIASLFIFVPLLLGLIVQSPLLAENGGMLNWAIWNDVTSSNHLGSSHAAHVPPMLFTIYIVWAIYVLIAANNPQQYWSFLDFTMWANIGHGLLMALQALTNLPRYWSKFLTDVPWILGIAVVIFLFRPWDKSTVTNRQPRGEWERANVS
jgi:hypothetical protein